MIICKMFILFFILSSCVRKLEQKESKESIIIKGQQTKSIDEIYSAFASPSLKHRKVQGDFAYIEQDEVTGKYLAKFITKEALLSIEYTSYGDSKKDVVTLGKQTFILQNKIDPYSIAVYWVYNYGKKYLCFIGKSQSASGSGVQVSYFMLFELENSGKISSFKEVTSRFGNINSLISNNENKDIGYLRIVNGKEQSQYTLTVHDIKTNQKLNRRLILLKYCLNDKFIILQDTSN